MEYSVSICYISRALIIKFYRLLIPNSNIKKKKVNKKRRLDALNVYTDAEVDYFIDTIKDVKPFPKLRDLRKLLSPTLSLDKINAILKYLERSKQILVDLDGNIVWIKNNNMKEASNLSETASFSKEFLEHFGKL